MPQNVVFMVEIDVFTELFFLKNCRLHLQHFECKNSKDLAFMDMKLMWISSEGMHTMTLTINYTLKYFILKADENNE